MTNKLVVIINSLKVPKIKKILLYEMKFLIQNYSCLQNPWLGGYCSQIPVLSVLYPQLNLLNPPPSKQNSWVLHSLVSLEFFIDIKSFRSHYDPGVDSASNKNEYQEHFLGVKAAGAQGWHPYHHPVLLSWNLGTLTSWNPLGHSRPVTGLLHLLPFIHYKNCTLLSMERFSLLYCE